MALQFNYEDVEVKEHLHAKKNNIITYLLKRFEYNNYLLLYYNNE